LQPDTVSLGFDTSTSYCVVSVVSGDLILAEMSEEASKNHAERLMYLIEDTLASAKLSLNNLNSIGVGVGPGNFTGIRVSVAAARGLSLALKIPAFGVSRFETLCYGYKKNILCSVNARKKQLYLSEYTNGTFGPNQLHDIDNLPTNSCEYIMGDQAELLSRKLNIKLLQPLYSSASSIAKIAQNFPMEKTPPKPIYPNYDTFDRTITLAKVMS
jgi:tRNA threonylcarbamoyladenosine biosynthesis protein TsaB